MAKHVNSQRYCVLIIANMAIAPQVAEGRNASKTSRCIVRVLGIEGGSFADVILDTKV
jgi:hypothetical protein